MMASAWMWPVRTCRSPEMTGRLDAPVRLARYGVNRPVPDDGTASSDGGVRWGCG